MKSVIVYASTFHGTYGCKGFNTYGQWKIIGDMNKGHPSKAEIQEAVDFFGEISK